ncbi:MAG: oligosaccharide flippase family protein [Calditrichaeota bacterium]|nr:oligosaccharide flippase family protein [Calditrichota bacterium]
MFARLTQLARHSVIYGLSTSIQRLQGLVLLPVYTSTLYIPSRSEFGDYTLVYTFIAFMNFFYLYGMDSALLRYFFLGRHDRRTVFSTTFLFLLTTSVITTGLIFIISPHLAQWILSDDRLTIYFRLAGLILLFDSLLNLPYLILRAEERPVSFTLYRTFRFLLELGLNLLFVVALKKGVLGILYANLTAAIINFGVMFPIIRRYFLPRIHRELAREMIRFGLPFLPNGIAYMTIEMVDRFLVKGILGKDVVGLYSANYKFGTVLLLMVVAFRNAWQPFFLKIAPQADSRTVFSRVLTYYVIIAGAVVLTVSYFIRDILTARYLGKFYLFGQQYWEGIPIIPIILLSYFFYGIYVILTPGFYILKKSQFMVVFTGSAAIINILANLILLPYLGIWGAAVSTWLSYFTMAFTIFLVSRRIYPIPIEWERIGKMFLLMAGLLCLYYWVPLAFWQRLGILLLGAIYVYGMVLNRREKEILSGQVTRWLPVWRNR